MNGWEVVWRAGDFDLVVEREVGGGTSGPRLHRVVAAGGRPGAVVVALHGDRVLLVRQTRAAVGRDLWEFPRGFADPGDADGQGTGVRELVEETGAVPGPARTLGTVWPDSGLLANGVEVVLVEVAGTGTTAGDGEVSECRWVPLDEVGSWIRGGRVCDGITLAAWALVCADR